MLKHNKTACNYIDPVKNTLVECSGREDIRFTKCGFGVEEVCSHLCAPVVKAILACCRCELIIVMLHQVMGISEYNDPAHIMYGMFYDQLGQMLMTVKDRKLFKEGVDFRAFSFADDGLLEQEDGIMVNRTWLENPENEETLVRFLKVMPPCHLTISKNYYPLRYDDLILVSRVRRVCIRGGSIAATIRMCVLTSSHQRGRIRNSHFTRDSRCTR